MYREKYINLLLSLSPKGIGWNILKGSNLYRLYSGISAEFARLNFYLDNFRSTAIELRSDAFVYELGYKSYNLDPDIFEPADMRFWVERIEQGSTGYVNTITKYIDTLDVNFVYVIGDIGTVYGDSSSLYGDSEYGGAGANNTKITIKIDEENSNANDVAKFKYAVGKFKPVYIIIEYKEYDYAKI